MMKVTDIPLNEYNPYFKPYIDKVGDSSLLKSLKKGRKETIKFFKKIPSSKLEYKYEDGKWTPKDILLHLIDAERAFSYRALQFARSNDADLEGFDENEFADNSNANLRSRKNLLKEYKAVRNASIVMFKSFSDETLLQMGKASESELSVRAAGFLICGHEIHHKQIINERYL
ncbi:MAG: DinB family protein [Flavobacteriaceae bacterium]